MDAYLEIAYTVLSRARKPMTASEILARAYELNIVPQRLYGLTQHKTLGARLSEDILLKRQYSQFYRISPGQFFIRDLLADDTIPAEYREPFTARRRFRELTNGPVLAVKRKYLRSFVRDNIVNDKRITMSIIKNASYSYTDPKEPAADEVLVYSFTVVRRGREALSYRVGRYRENRDDFVSKSSMGFTSLVTEDQYNFFSLESVGITEAGLHAAVADLDIPTTRGSKFDITIDGCVWVDDKRDNNGLVVYLSLECPNWFHPETRKLAINKLRWVDLYSKPNNIYDFEPWSQFWWNYRLSW